MTSVIVGDINNPESIIEAFQQALDMTVTRERIEEILAARDDKCHYQHILQQNGNPPIGCVTIFAMGSKETITLFVMISCDQTDIAASLASFAKRAYLWFDNTSLRIQFREEEGEVYRATICLPSQMFLNASPLQIHLD